MNPESININNIEYNQLNWETFWNKHKEHIEQELQKALKPFYAQDPELFNEEFKKKDLVKKMQAEKEFTKIVLTNLKEILEKGKPVTLLFDVDETIGSPYYDRASQVHTILRPVLFSIFEETKQLIEKGKLNIGLLTSRGTPVQQLDEPRHLQPLKGYLNPDYIYSSYPYSRGLMDSGKEIEQLRNNKNGVIDPQLSEGKYVSAQNTGSLTKLKVLEEIKEKHPDMNFIIVDDDNYPDCLDKSKGLYGVRIGKEAWFMVGYY